MNNDSRIRILHILGGLNTGGAETLVMNIYRNIDKNKFQFDFVVHGDNVGFYENEIKALGGRIYRVPQYKGMNHLKYISEWNKFFDSHPEYSIIHCHIRSTAAIILKIAKEHGLITICHSHNTSNGSGVSALVKNYFQKKIPNYADYLLACSKESARWLYGNALASSEKCMVINNAIDSFKYMFNENVRLDVRRKLGIEKRVVLGQVGRLTAAKNYEFTLGLLNQLKNQDTNIFLLIIGAGELKNKLLDQIKEYKLDDNVVIFENRKDVNELMQAMDVFIMPSLWEGLPLALVEAQASSLPCIISENVRDGIILNDKVFKVNLDSQEKWINTINRIINNNYPRKDERDEIKKSGFDIQENIDIISNFYLKILKSANC